MTNRQIEIQLGERIFTADLVEKEAPKLCDIVWKYLEKPLETTVVHAKFAGAELLFMLPLMLTGIRENSRKVFETKAGDICNYPDRQLMLLFYGECIQERVDVDLFARIVKEDLDDLVAEGRGVWLNSCGKIVMRRKVEGRK